MEVSRLGPSSASTTVSALPGLDRHRHDLLAEALPVLCCDGLLVAAQREAVLGLPGDVVLLGEALGLVLVRGDEEALLGEVLGGRAERVGVAELLHPRVDEAPA
jgi:hypothetical protein